MATARPSRKLEDIFTCCLCFEQYDITVNIPKGLPCQHTFCAPCLDKHIRAVGDNCQEPKCPKCQREFLIPKGGAGELPTNLSVQDMMELNLHQEARLQDSLQKAKDVKHFNCKEHVDRHVIMVCLKCEVGLCINCMKTIHKSDHIEHDREDIETYLSNYKKAVDALKEGSGKLPELIHQAEKEADKRLADIKREREKEIDQQAERAIQEVKKWQERQKYHVFFPANPFHSRVKSRKSAAEHHGIAVTKSYDIHHHKAFTADVQTLDKFKTEKIPSLSETEHMMDQLSRMKTECLSLSKREFQKPPIETLQLSSGNKNKLAEQWSVFENKERHMRVSHDDI